MRPAVLLTSLTRSWRGFVVLSAIVLTQDLFDRLAALRRDLLRRADAGQALDSGLDDIDRIARPVTFRQHVAHASAFEHRPHRTASNDAGTVRGRLHVHLRGAVMALGGVLQRLVPQLDATHVLACRLHRLLDRHGHFARLAVTVADTTGAVAHDGECGEAELATPLHDLRHAVHGDELLNEVVAGAVSFWCCHCSTVPGRLPRTRDRFRGPHRPGPSPCRGSGTPSGRKPPCSRRRPWPPRRSPGQRPRRLRYCLSFRSLRAPQAAASTPRPAPFRHPAK